MLMSLGEAHHGELTSTDAFACAFLSNFIIVVGSEWYKAGGQYICPITHIGCYKNEIPVVQKFPTFRFLKARAGQEFKRVWVGNRTKKAGARKYGGTHSRQQFWLLWNRNRYVENPSVELGCPVGETSKTTAELARMRQPHHEAETQNQIFEVPSSQNEEESSIRLTRWDMLGVEIDWMKKPWVRKQKN